MAAGHTLQTPDTITQSAPRGGRSTPADETSAFPGGADPGAERSLLGRQKFPYGGDGAFDAFGIDVEVGDEAQAVQSGDEDSAGLEVGDEGGDLMLGGAGQVGEEDVGVGGGDFEAGQVGEAGGELGDEGVVVREAVDVMFEGMGGGGGEQAGLAQSASGHFADAVGAGDKFAGSAEGGADRGAQTFAEADGGTIEKARDVPCFVLWRLAGGGGDVDGGIKQAGSVQMGLQAVGARQGGGLLEVGHGQRASTDGVFQGEQTSAGEVGVVWFDTGFDVSE